MFELCKVDNRTATLHLAEIFFKAEYAVAVKIADAVVSEGFFSPVVFAVDMKIQG